MSMESFVHAEDRVLERFGIAAERRVVDVPVVGGSARVLVAGMGPPVLMMIGAGPPAALWAPLMARLTGFTLHVVDPPGMGGTAPIRYATATLRSTAVAFLDQVREGLGLARAPVIAQSVGGLWSIWYALERPERVSALVLVGCPALMLGAMPPLPLRLMAVRGLGALMMRLRPPSARQVEQSARMAGEDFTTEPEIRDLWLELERLPSSARSLRDVAHAMLRVRGPRHEVELTADQLSGLRVPVQLIWGERDPFGSPEVGRRAAEVIPGAELHVVPGGHAPWLRQAARIAELAAPFLRRHAAAATAPSHQTTTTFESGAR